MRQCQSKARVLSAIMIQLSAHTTSTTTRLSRYTVDGDDYIIVCGIVWARKNSRNCHKPHFFVLCGAVLCCVNFTVLFRPLSPNPAPPDTTDTLQQAATTEPSGCCVVVCCDQWFIIAARARARTQKAVIYLRSPVPRMRR